MYRIGGFPLPPTPQKQGRKQRQHVLQTTQRASSRRLAIARDWLAGGGNWRAEPPNGDVKVPGTSGPPPSLAARGPVTLPNQQASEGPCRRWTCGRRFVIRDLDPKTPPFLPLDPFPRLPQRRYLRDYRRPARLCKRHLVCSVRSLAIEKPGHLPADSASLFPRRPVLCSLRSRTSRRIAFFPPAILLFFLLIFIYIFLARSSSFW